MDKVGNLCECGCGGITNNGSRFIQGHNKSMLGKHHSDRSRRKIQLALISDKNSFYDKHYFEKTKKVSPNNIGGYKALHQWINNNRLKPTSGLCEICHFLCYRNI